MTIQILIARVASLYVWILGKQSPYARRGANI